jgi:hypothetical protein
MNDDDKKMKSTDKKEEETKKKMEEASEPGAAATTATTTSSLPSKQRVGAPASRPGVVAVEPAVVTTASAVVSSTTGKQRVGAAASRPGAVAVEPGTAASTRDAAVTAKQAGPTAASVKTKTGAPAPGIVAMEPGAVTTATAMLSSSSNHSATTDKKSRLGPAATTPGVQAMEPTAAASSVSTAKVREGARAVEPGAVTLPSSSSSAPSKTAPPVVSSTRNISEKVAEVETTSRSTAAMREATAVAVAKDTTDAEKSEIFVAVADKEESTFSVAKSTEFGEHDKGHVTVQVDHGMVQPPTFEPYSTIKDKDKDKGGEEEGLAIAIPVDERKDVVAAEEYEEMEKLPFYKRKIFWGLMLLLVIAAVVIGVVVASVSGSSDDVPPVIVNGTLMPTSSPTSAPTGSVERIFREALVDEVDFALGAPTSLASRAFFRAADWFYVDGDFDRLSVPEDGFTATGTQGIQRFVLAWLYYHTTDVGTDPWISCNPPRADRNETDTCTFLDSSSVFDLADGVEICYFGVEDFARWLTATPECEWPAVFCNDAGVVEGLELNGIGLSGSFPPFLHLFPELSEVQLQYGALTGNIPTEIGLLSNLEALDIQGNVFNDPFPDSLFELPLIRLNFAWNAFNGTLPSAVGKLSSILGLFLYNTPITGPLPPELGNATTLVNFRMSGNNLAGESLPESWGKSIAGSLRGPIHRLSPNDFPRQVIS